MKKFTGFVTLSVILCFLILFANSAGAIPHLGVIDTYLLENWDANVPFEGPFAYPGSGEITVWWGNEEGAADPNVEIFIATATAADGIPDDDFSFTTATSIHTEVGEVENPPSQWGNTNLYDPNYMISLGSVTSNSAWVDASTVLDPITHPLLADDGQFYLLSGTFEGTFPAGVSWIYAMADTGGETGVFDNGKDEFSPPTMSTVVPEPSTVLLIGIGLIGLGIFRRKLIRKS